MIAKIIGVLMLVILLGGIFIIGAITIGPWMMMLKAMGFALGIVIWTIIAAYLIIEKA